MDRVKLIEAPKEGALVRLELIDHARESIDIAYYTFRNGKLAKMILASILNAANRGVKVRILLDSLSFLPSLAGPLKDVMYGMDAHENIDWKFYHPVNPLFPFNWNKRLHDKMILIDSNLALVGGRNISDNYYLGDTRWRSFSKDRDVLIYRDEGLEDYTSVIDHMKDYYQETWDYRFSRSLVRKLNSKQKIKSDLILENFKIESLQIKDEFKTKSTPIDWYKYTRAVENVDFIHNPVGKINHDPWCLKKILALSSQAKKSIFIQSPYIIPTKKIHKDFKAYNIDLKKTTILTNSYYSSPNHLSIAAYSNYRNHMIDKGVRICEYQGQGSLHGKTYVFDDYISVIGSFNLDSRSSYINSETIIAIYSQEFAEKLKNNIEIDLDKALELDKNYDYIETGKIKKGKVSKLKKIIIGILSKLAPIFENML